MGNGIMNQPFGLNVASVNIGGGGRGLGVLITLLEFIRVHNKALE